MNWKRSLLRVSIGLILLAVTHLWIKEPDWAFVLGWAASYIPYRVGAK